jgi:hypothetical protein
MKKQLNSHSWGIVMIFTFIFLFSTLSLVAQDVVPLSGPSLWEDTSLNPHDFNNRVYNSNGINVKSMVGRLTGSDGLSVFSPSSNPDHTDVQVLITIPAYDQYGQVTFWYPLGEIRDNGFTEDKIGAQARETAKMLPIYIFPNPNARMFNSFINGRQAPIIDDSTTKGGQTGQIGLREIRVVYYTEKALGKEGIDMMDYFSKKNGLAIDGTPLIKSVDDILYLQERDFITTDPPVFELPVPFGGQYALSTVIVDPTKGVIARDAFLWMSAIDGKPMPDEQIFVWQFGCLQKTGDWCQK